MPRLLIIIACILVVIVLFAVIIISISPMRQHIQARAKIEPYSKNGDDCKGSFPPTPRVFPEAAYAKLFYPTSRSDGNPVFPNPDLNFPETSSVNKLPSDVLSSANNPDTKTTDYISPDGKVIYSDNVCNTPADMYCVSRDSCAQYGIGENCEGPQGYQRCVCEARVKPGVKPGVSQNKEITSKDIIINYGAACTEDSQCITGLCRGDSLYSKYCGCKDNEDWDIDKNKCVQKYDDRVYKPHPPPKGACPPGSVGTPCRSNKGLPKGMACNRDGYAICLLSNPTTNEENLILEGGLCENTSECYGNLECSMNKLGDKVCRCPAGMTWDDSLYTNTCLCNDYYAVYDKSEGKCYIPGTEPNRICPNSRANPFESDSLAPMSPCRDDRDVGLGEYCDMSQHVAVCNAPDVPFNNLILQGGRCSKNNDCKSGRCVKREQSDLFFCAA